MLRLRYCQLQKGLLAVQSQTRSLPSSVTSFAFSTKAIASVNPTNQHVTVDTDGNPVVLLKFIEEPLGLPASEGYGFPRFEFGEAIGPDKRFVIMRKLGYGTTSSTWLARDKKEKNYVAVKALNGSQTTLMRRDIFWELEALKSVSATSKTSPHCLKLLSSFFLPGKGSDGEHACFVTEFLGGDVKSLQGDKVFPLPLAKRILLHLLRGIAHAHNNGVVHTDLKGSNIFFDAKMSDVKIARLLSEDPSQRHLPEATYNGTVQAAVSQPLPLPSFEEAMKRTFLLADFGSAQPINNHKFNEITPVALRPPEIYLGGPWDEKVDIWTFGCLIYEISTSKALFRYVPGTKLDLDEVEFMLYQMICFTGEEFDEKQLAASSLADKYFFDSSHRLKKQPDLYNVPFEYAIEDSNVIPNEDISPMANIMKRCLRLDPKNRASAEELLTDPWFDGVD